MKARAKILIRGIVQGVGFRPFIYNLAKAHLLNGWVLNSTEGVSIEVEGEEQAIETFIDEIPKKAPPLAMIDSVDVEYLPLIGYETFVIKALHEVSAERSEHVSHFTKRWCVE